jgi:hypothetical protein
VSATIKNLTTLIRTKSKSPQTTGKATGSKAAAKVFFLCITFCYIIYFCM